MHASACDVTGRCMHLTGLCMHVLHTLPHDITGQCMQLLHGLCCFDFISDIPLSPATLPVDSVDSIDIYVGPYHVARLTEIVLSEP